MHLTPSPLAEAAVLSKAVGSLLIVAPIVCGGGGCFILVFYAVLRVLSGFTIIFIGNRELIAFLGSTVAQW